MAAMSTSQLVDHVAESTGLSKTQAKQAVSAVFDALSERLASGERVQLSGFGSFEVRERAERQGTNPKTKQKMTIAASRGVGFRPAASLRDRVGGRGGS